MNSKEVKSIVEIIRDAGNNELVIVSLFILPILLGAWSVLMNNLTFLNEYSGLKLIVLCFLLLFYVGGLLYMKFTDSEDDKLSRARFHVETRLKKRGGNRASFDAIRDEVDETYTDEFLKKLIDKNPEIFGRCKIKRSDGNRPGITLVKTESEEN